MGIKIPNINCIYFERFGKCKINYGLTCILIHTYDGRVCNKQKVHIRPVPPPPPPPKINN